MVDTGNFTDEGRDRVSFQVRVVVNLPRRIQDVHSARQVLAASRRGQVMLADPSVKAAEILTLTERLLHERQPDGSWSLLMLADTFVPSRFKRQDDDWLDEVAEAEAFALAFWAQDVDETLTDEDIKLTIKKFHSNG